MTFAVLFFIAGLFVFLLVVGSCLESMGVFKRKIK